MSELPPASPSIRRYHVHEVLGQGGFGTVYRAELLSAGGFCKLVALKVLHDDLGQRPEVVKRLKDEAKMLGLLRHRAIVQVDDLLQIGGRWAVAMEYVEGASLAELISAVDVPPKVVLEIAEEVADALFVAYEKPARGGQPLALIHRDIKPSNIQITASGEAKLLDFGIARGTFEGREAVTRAVVLGSLPYMAPERVDLEDTHAGDVYALAITICESISREHPTPTKLDPKKHVAHIEALIARVQARAPDPALIALLRNCLEYEPEDRPTAREMERRLRDIRAQMPGPWLRDWAEAAVTPAVRSRQRVSDELSGEILAGGTLGTLIPRGAEPTLAPAEEDLTRWEPTPAPSEAPPRTWVRWVLGGVAALAAVLVLSALVTGGLAVLGVGWIGGEVLDESVASSLDEALALVDGLPDQPNREVLHETLVAAKTDPRREANLGLWELTGWSLELEDATADGRIDDDERRVLIHQFEALLAD